MAQSMVTAEKLASSPLGSFAVLPPEIRHMIWRNFMPPDPIRGRQRRGFLCIKPLSKYSKADNLAIMRTSHRINDELRDYLYEQRVLSIKIDPPNDGWWAKKGLPGLTGDKNFELVKNTNLAWFKQISIELCAPNAEDAGQLLQLRRILMNLVMKLTDAAALPDVHISFTESNTNSWYTDNGILQKSIDGHAQDIIVLLRLFRCVHKVTKVTITLPYTSSAQNSDLLEREADQRDLHMCAKHVQTVMESQEASFCISLKRGPKQDRDIFGEEMTITLRHDLALDYLRGYTANLLRLYRFADFGSYKRMFKSAIRRSDIDEIERTNLYGALHKRSTMRQYLHPKTGSRLCDWVSRHNEEGDWHKRYKQGLPTWRYFTPDERVALGGSP